MTLKECLRIGTIGDQKTVEACIGYIQAHARDIFGNEGNISEMEQLFHEVELMGKETNFTLGSKTETVLNCEREEK